jgi:hypothetical protein
MDLQQRIGFPPSESPEHLITLRRYLNLKLADLGLPIVPLPGLSQREFTDLVGSFLAHSREKDRLLSSYLCPADQRIQTFLFDYISDAAPVPRLPTLTLALDRHGLARELSLPADRDEYVSPTLRSFRVRNGILHNPKSDRRTTAGIFHVAEGGLPIPDDKRAVPVATFARMLARALNPPREMMRLPFTSTLPEPAECFVSLLLRPVVCPEVPGFTREKSIEIRFFVPGTLVSNLDFVESIFGNAGDPFLPENDAALDVEHWSGHTGCVILAPHLTGITKKEAGLPPFDAATERQRRDGMCWRDEAELYNDGGAFKLTARDAGGTIVTIISDNYFGYCKKEVKTQLSFAANLFGLAEEEHAGGALIFPSYDLAEEFSAAGHPSHVGFRFADVRTALADSIVLQPEGHAVDRLFPDVIYVPDDTSFDLRAQTVSWPRGGGTESLKLLYQHTYVLPSGYKVHLEKPPANRAWRLIGTRPEGTLCHKPCTVSGGGKSEISKPISDAIIHGPVFVSRFAEDFDAVEALLARDYSGRFRDPGLRGDDDRSLLSPKRSLGSVIKLLTPSTDFSDEYNTWLEGIPQHLKELVFTLKRFHQPEWGDNWRGQFSVDIVDGRPANELRYRRRKLQANYLRVGYADDGSWRTFSLRKDFHPAAKIQFEDDITVSVAVPREALVKPVSHLSNRFPLASNAQPETSNGPSLLAPQAHQPALKFVHNCEYRLFQRPDDAIVRGYDHAAERDFTARDNFFSNYEPLPAAAVKELLDDAVGFHQFTEPMQEFVRSVGADPSASWFVTTAHPRIVDGKPSKNPRYLQIRPDLTDPRGRHLAEVGARLARGLSPEQPVLWPVNAVLSGRRNNAAEPPKVRSLACYNPMHYLELPELFMEYISSMTGKSPSTTGAGSEGALTKGPFNALPPIYDLNVALVSFLVSGYDGFLTSAGCVGPRVRVDHDLSLLIPEVWARMGADERSASRLIREGCLERCVDYERDGQRVLASRLGYRITEKFVKTYFGRVFNNPHAVLTPEMLRPELQDPAEFADAIDNVVGTHRAVARHYFTDGSIEWACPPLRALLHLMRDGRFEGRALDDEAIRSLFTREALLASDWYRDRLRAKQVVDTQLWQRHCQQLDKFISRANYAGETERLGLRERLSLARATLERVKSQTYPNSLVGTIGAEPAIWLR